VDANLESVNPAGFGRTRRTAAVAAVGLLALSCLTTACNPARVKRWPRLEVPAQGVVLEPRPPSSVVWLRIASAHVPPAWPNGNPWDEDGSGPDPYVVLTVNGEKLLQSSVANDTTDPKWKHGPRGNYEIPDGAKVRLEVFDDDRVGGQSIAAAEVSPPRADETKDGIETFDLGGGARVGLAVEPAHPLWGLGFDYKLILGTCRITSVFTHGPAGRIGMRAGDELVEVGGAKVEDMSAESLRAAFGPIPAQGLALLIKHQEGTTQKARLAEGPIYALVSEHGPVD